MNKKNIKILPYLVQTLGNLQSENVNKILHCAAKNLLVINLPHKHNLRSLEHLLTNRMHLSDSTTYP